jgi:hypothetical protein
MEKCQEEIPDTTGRHSENRGDENNKRVAETFRFP